MHGGRLVARTLSRRGITTVFGLCGDHVNAIFDGLATEGIRIVDTRDERAAASMAQGWSLATGTPGVACVTGSPGLAAAMGPIADASMAGIPMVVVTSRIRAAEEGRGFPQDVAAERIAGGLAAVVTIRDAASIPGSIADAFRDTLAARRPVVVEVSLDAQLAKVADTEPAASPAAAPARRIDGVARAARLLGESLRPVAIVGEGCFWSGAEDAVRLLAEDAGIPVFTVRAARGLLPDDHEMCFGPPNFLREPVRAALDRADTLLVAGCDLDIVLAFGGLAPQARLIRIERTSARVRRNRVPDVAIVADEAAALAKLAEGLRGRAAGSWPAQIGDLFAGEPSTPAPLGSPVHPATLVEAVSRAVAGRATFSIDAGALALWALGGLPARGPGRLLTSFGTPASTIGGGLSYAVAAKLARPDEPAVAVLGDGAFGYQAMELDTAARHGVDVVAVVGNDASWGIVRQQMEGSFGRAVAADLAPRDYAATAKSLGAAGERVADATGLGEALRRALSARGPALVDVALDRAVRHEAMTFIEAMFAPDR